MRGRIAEGWALHLHYRQGMQFPLRFKSAWVNWFFRAARNNLILCCAFLALWFGLHQMQVTQRVPQSLGEARAEKTELKLQHFHALGGIAEQVNNPMLSTSELPPVAELVYLPPRRTTSVRPNGWRKTSKGWEHTSSWEVKPSLAEVLIQERARESHWISFFLQGVRSIPPLAYASLQIAAIAAIYQCSVLTKKIPSMESYGATGNDQDCCS